MFFCRKFLETWSLISVSWIAGFVLIVLPCASPSLRLPLSLACLSLCLYLWICISVTDLQTILTCCSTQIEVADQTFYLSQSQYTDTGLASPNTDSLTPGLRHSIHCLTGVVVKASASGAEDPGFESCLWQDFSGSSHASDLKIGTPVATLPGAWHYRVSTGTGQPGVSILWLGEVDTSIAKS